VSRHESGEQNYKPIGIDIKIQQSIFISSGVIIFIVDVGNLTCFGLYYAIIRVIFLVTKIYTLHIFIVISIEGLSSGDIV
jgi:hypothetical protein